MRSTFMGLNFLAMLAVCWLGPAQAVKSQEEPGAPTQQEVQDELAQIRQSLALSEQRAEQLRGEIEALSGDRAAQNAALIAAAERARQAESEVAVMEQRMAQLLQQEAAIRARLDSTDGDMANLLGALQKIGQNPPPALIVNPTDALDAARSAMLLSAILPQYRERADRIAADLAQLATITQAARQEEAALTANFRKLFEEQLRIATLIEARKQGAGRIGALLTAEEQHAERLAEEAKSLDQLVDTLSRRMAAIGATPGAGELAAG